MAKLTARFDVFRSGGFDTVLHALHDEILNGSISASYEDGSDYRDANGTRVAVRVYERFSWLGGNRVSLNLTLVGSGEQLFLTVITSGVCFSRIAVRNRSARWGLAETQFPLLRNVVKPGVITYHSILESRLLRDHHLEEQG